MNDPDRILHQPPAGAAGLRRLWRALGYSFDGLGAAWKHEAAFRQEALLAIVFVPLGLWLGHTGAERALLAGSVLLVMVIELLNSGLEAIVDRASPERHELAKRAKDTGSAAVLLALAICVMTWMLVLWPDFFGSAPS
ncbi:MAG: diacylglycerol kinase [Betaproteobacteria bacterium]